MKEIHMTEWRIKEISELTKMSVRMLRHYDKIGLLKPSYRAANGYRYYTAQDLATLQQIVALKYFGFDLKTIKAILQKHQNIYAHLQAQQQLVKHQFDHLQKVNEALGSILNHLSPNETPGWNEIMTLIEGYRMTEHLRDKLKKSWAGKALTETQFEDYLLLYEQFPNELAMRDKLISQLNNNEFGDPTGADGEHYISVMYDIAKKIKKSFALQAKLGSSVLASMQSGQLTQLEVTPEGINWISRATFAYWLKRWDKIYDNIVSNLSADPEGQVGKKIANEWTGLINEHFSIGCQALSVGVLLWQELARQANELEKQKTMPSPQEMAKQMHVKLLFNPDAMSWISRALVAHSI
jgi:DNA-binding transcriptional MerR regulator